MSRVRILVLALALALLALPRGAAAIDAPHESGTTCSNCHMGHNTLGGGLTHTAGNASLCFSCHQNTARYNWSAADQAVPGTSGHSHHWSAPATGEGATPPAPGTPMGDRLTGGNLQCSVCHNEHQADGAMGSPADPANVGAQHVSAITKAGTGTGTMALAAGSPAATAAAKFYRVEIVAAGTSTTATFRVSNDKGASWFGCTAPTTYTYVAYAANACRANTTAVPLNDGSNVSVTFTGGTGAFAVGDRWDFYVTYPFLRVANKDAAMCLECHRDKHQTWQNADGTGPIVGTGQAIVFGTTRFSHPVGQALNQGGRTNGLAAILDADGQAQSASTDTNRSNDLVLGTGGIVTCLTCHRPHLADSNSLTDDSQ